MPVSLKLICDEAKKRLDFGIMHRHASRVVKEVLELACSRLSVSGGLKKRAGDEWGLVGKKERSKLDKIRHAFDVHWHSPRIRAGPNTINSIYK